MVSRGMRDTVLPSFNLLITSKVDQRWTLTTVSTTCRKNGILLSVIDESREEGQCTCSRSGLLAAKEPQLRPP